MQMCPNQVIYLRQQRQTYDVKVGSSYRDRKAAEAITLLSEGGIMARKGKRVLLSMIRGQICYVSDEEFVFQDVSCS